MFVRCHLLERNKSLEDSFLQDAILHQIMNTFCLTFSTARSLSHGGITLTLLFAANEELSAGHFCNLTRFDHDELRQIWDAFTISRLSFGRRKEDILGWVRFQNIRLSRRRCIFVFRIIKLYLYQNRSSEYICQIMQMFFNHDTD